MEISLLFWGFAILALVGYGCQIWALRKTISREKGASACISSPVTPLPGISVLKPLTGLDDKLFDNLESFCVQDYPGYEIIFSLQDHNDPACKVARKVKEKFPGKDITLIAERCQAGLNPKVNNLIPAYRIAKYEHILISDSNVAVGKDYLRSIMRDMQTPGSGLVSNLIKGMEGRSLGSVLENLHLNSFIIGSVCFLDRYLKIPCVVGKSMLMKKEDLEKIGGLYAVKDVLAEDYVIGKKMHEAGKRVVLSSYTIRNVNEYWGLKRFINRHTRWGKLRWKIGGFRYLSELVGNAVFMSLFPVMLWEPSKVTVAFAAGVSILKIAGDMYIGRKIRSDMNPLLYLLAPLKDFIIGLAWFVPILSSTVVWRGNRYYIGKDSVLFPCETEGVWSWRYRLADAIRMRFA